MKLRMTVIGYSNIELLCEKRANEMRTIVVVEEVLARATSWMRIVYRQVELMIPISSVTEATRLWQCLIKC